MRRQTRRPTSRSIQSTMRDRSTPTASVSRPGMKPTSEAWLPLSTESCHILRGLSFKAVKFSLIPFSSNARGFASSKRLQNPAAASTPSCSTKTQKPTNWMCPKCATSPPQVGIIVSSNDNVDQHRVWLWLHKQRDGEVCGFSADLSVPPCLLWEDLSCSNLVCTLGGWEV